MDHHSEYPLGGGGGGVAVNCEFRGEKAMRNFASKSFIDAEFLHLSFVLELLYWISSAASRPFDKNTSFEVQYILGNCWLCPLSLFFL